MGFTFIPKEAAQLTMQKHGKQGRVTEPRHTIKTLLVDPFLAATDPDGNPLAYSWVGLREDGTGQGLTWQNMLDDPDLAPVCRMVEDKNKSLNGSTVRDIVAVINRYKKDWGVDCKFIERSSEDGTPAELEFVMRNVKRIEQVREQEVAAASEASKQKREAASKAAA